MYRGSKISLKGQNIAFHVFLSHFVQVVTVALVLTYNMSHYASGILSFFGCRDNRHCLMSLTDLLEKYTH